LLRLLVLLLFIFPLYGVSETINIPLNNWASQRVISKAVGTLLQHQGVDVQYVEIDSDKQWGALSRGQLHFQVEVWEPSMADVFQKYPNVKDAGTHSATVREEWWYPYWVERLCPELPDWRALKKCAHIFSTDQSEKGTYFTGPWEYNDPELIRSLGLNFEIQRVQDDKALWELLRASKKSQQPILMLNWTPNWVDNRIEGRFVEFPSYSKKCEIDPKHGVNSEMTHDCGNPKNGWLKKAKWVGLRESYPCINRFIENLNLSNYMIAEASALASSEGITEDEASERWLKAFSTSTKNWLPKNCQISAEIATKHVVALPEETKLTVVTEDWPPFSYLDENGQVNGLTTELVKQLLADQGIHYELELLPWNRAYQKAKNESNVAIYSIYRTKERESHFYWYCPLMDPVPVYVYSKSTRQGINVNTLNDLRHYTLGVTRDSFASKELLKNPIYEQLHINSGSDDAVNVKTLLNGRVDLILDTEEALKYRLGLWGLTMSEVKRHMEFKMSSVKALCMAFNKGTSLNILNKLNIQRDISL